MCIREQTENFERERLSKYAQLSADYRGRKIKITPCSLRTEYQSDRDRIIHCKAFRRLNHKTQVFLSPEGDHYRTRLTHTLEVSQIARTIARALHLNEDLTEAISLGHDLGHTPFGHVGEEALREVGIDFNHNEQSIRVVELIEYNGKGLNLTWEVRDGILGHTGKHLPATLEGRLVRISDRIAYINHDIDDAVRAGIIEESDLPDEALKYFGAHHGQRINSMVTEMIDASKGGSQIRMTDKGEKIMNNLRAYLFGNIYLKSPAKTEDKKAKMVLKALYNYYYTKPENLPVEYQPSPDDKLADKVSDYIAGMTDRFALRTYQDLFVPRSWMV
ncbi:MAG TPA: deoxyguanosinetriphosphate triphosphohydrolase [Actinobacteria bacterium]|nr:deoxyguanosinetriphosphate triphosphohydrolase [Actinomycetes bacterium]HEX21733.1 deoxyguanosinetriphosphate triphosphohydrolase [Actinomycetota bacterium]